MVLPALTNNKLWCSAVHNHYKCESEVEVRQTIAKLTLKTSLARYAHKYPSLLDLLELLSNVLKVDIITHKIGLQS